MNAEKLNLYKTEPLKPCPFCGHNAVIMGKRAVYIMCGYYLCMARTEKYSSVYFAKRAWNSRVNEKGKEGAEK